MFREYKERHIYLNILTLKYVPLPLCYTTGESKTCLWCKLCLTFTGSGTEWMLAEKQCQSVDQLEGEEKK